MIRGALLALALVASGCSSAEAGSFLTGGFSGAGGGAAGGGASGAAWTDLADIDFTAETAHTFVDGSVHTTDGGHELVWNTNGTAAISSNGLTMAGVAQSVVSLRFSSLSWGTDYGISRTRGWVRVVVQFDTTLTDVNDAAGEGAFVGLSGDLGGSVGAGRQQIQTFVVYDGATYDLDVYHHWGLGSQTEAQAGNLAALPEFCAIDWAGMGAEFAYGDASLFPETKADFSTLRGVITTGPESAGVIGATSVDFTADTSTYEGGLQFGKGNTGGDVVVKRVRIQRYQ